MKFYNRKQELKDLKQIIDRDFSDLVYISWRRRIWKTKLILKVLEKKSFLYFFVWEKTKWELLNDFTQIVQQKLSLKYLKFQNFKEFFDFLFDFAQKEKFILVFDEFQNFKNIDKTVFSDLQYLRDMYKDKANIKMFCLWSHFTLMKEIFENYSSPLYWRKTASFHLKAFNINTQINILKDFDLLSEKNLLYIFSIFGGIPKYLEIILQSNLHKNNLLDDILNEYFKDNSFFINEWRELFALEFGKSFEIYFSILTAIAVGKTKRWEIADFTGISNDSLGVYLQKLENYYELIDRKLPITEKKNSKNPRYQIKDLFLKFWFRYVYKYDYLIEIWDFQQLKDVVKQDIETFLWFAFEEMVKQIIIEKNKLWKMPFKIEKIWTYFDRKWQNEIDIVCVNEKEKKVLFVECKLNVKKFSLKHLQEKVEKTGIYRNYKKYYWVASLNVLKCNADWCLSLREVVEN